MTSRVEASASGPSSQRAFLEAIEALPLEPRVWFPGSGVSAFDRPWKERLLRRTGGILPATTPGEQLAAVVTRTHPEAVDPPAIPRRWPWPTRLLR